MASPITSERENIQILRESGFTQQQAEAVALVVERAIQQGFEKFAEVLQRELSAIRNEMTQMRNELRIEIRDVRNDLQKSITELSWKIFAIVVGVAAVAVAIIKLSPNWY
jgi:flagellar biosynthesis/type III secretory pathway protein FliH